MRNIKITAVLTAFLFTFAVFFTDMGAINAEAAFTPDVDIQSSGYYMVNLDLDTVIAAKNEHDRCYPASVTKVMTAIVALENCSNLEREVAVTYAATNEFWEDNPNYTGAGTCGLDVGQTGLTMRDCLYGMLVQSGCEAANVIGINIAGDLPTFIDLMNKKAQELGMTNTHFSNTHGLWHAENYSTPYDLYLMCRYAYEKHPTLIEISNTQEYTLPANTYNPNPYTIINTNALIRNIDENVYYYEYAKNIKTGSIDVYWDAAGNEHPGMMNMASMATQNGFNYLLVTTGAPYYDAEGVKTNAHFTDHIAMYKWAFRTFDIMEVLNEHMVITNLKVDMGEEADTVILKSSSAFSTLLPRNLDTNVIEQRITITADMNDNKAVVAPIEKGQVMGTLDLVMDGEVIATRNLIASQSISLSQFEYTMRMINSIFEKDWFRLCIASLAVLIIADLILNGVRKSRIAKMEARQKRRNNVSKKW
ncbi:MAG: D-alanyl-D-alanine carboxypeptidase [Ruminiclostridium sp.]|nr:D-alanyl-D-alanine carboxypeptidase [Ruminiclostridium sp.]